MTPKRERLQWILQYIQDRSKGGGPPWTVDCLQSDFVWAYAEANNVNIRPSFVGAPFCELLRNDLKALYDEGALRRWRSSIDGFGRYSGFPTWVYSYTLNPKSPST